MEDNPPTQNARRPADHQGPSDGELPRNRTPFRAPEPAQPEARPETAPPGRSSRRSGSTAAPPVTFQPPAEDDAPTGRRAAPRKTARSRPAAGTPTDPAAAPGTVAPPVSPRRKGAKAGSQAAGSAADSESASTGPDTAGPGMETPPAETRATSRARPTARASSSTRPGPPTPATPPAEIAATGEMAPTGERAIAPQAGPDARGGTAAKDADSARHPAAPKLPDTGTTGTPPRKAGTPRRAGMAARTEITTAKAFPQQSTGEPASGPPSAPQEGGAAPVKKVARRAAKASRSATQPPLERPAPADAPSQAQVPGQAAPEAQGPEQTVSVASDASPGPVVAESAASPQVVSAAVVRPTGSGSQPTNRSSEDRVRRLVTEAWARVVADPGHAPELLALAAVRSVGPRAADWAREVRESYPSATPDAVARLAIRQFTRRGAVSSAFAAVAGLYAPVALVSAAGYAQAELALHVAGAYGQDPTDPARAAELLVLSRVHPTRQQAEAAIAAADAPADRDEAADGSTWRFGRPVAVQVGGWTVLRAANRFFPGTAVLGSALVSRAATEAIGVRAIAFYRAAAR